MTQEVREDELPKKFEQIRRQLEHVMREMEIGHWFVFLDDAESEISIMASSRLSQKTELKFSRDMMLAGHEMWDRCMKEMGIDREVPFSGPFEVDEEDDDGEVV